MHFQTTLTFTLVLPMIRAEYALIFFSDSLPDVSQIYEEVYTYFHGRLTIETAVAQFSLSEAPHA